MKNLDMETYIVGSSFNPMIVLGDFFTNEEFGTIIGLVKQLCSSGF